ncbi:putative leucine-rich repeat protein [Trypanosoma theileri]|uniref:Putative leucine-rich repeat protein n=1 Tax=Trypanosoma theileri TaxID=67003 RepID=A0A1X0NG16_9TRYP|nr:putative leucine-rich repeat protein [Trypanosoma theileri]ORC83655.1 putative leucine-rich repeat protein [Trypanosoma theileri]
MCPMNPILLHSVTLYLQQRIPLAFLCASPETRFAAEQRLLFTELNSENMDIENSGVVVGDAVVYIVNNTQRLHRYIKLRHYTTREEKTLQCMAWWLSRPIGEEEQLLPLSVLIECPVQKGKNALDVLFSLPGLVEVHFSQCDNMTNSNALISLPSPRIPDLSSNAMIENGYLQFSHYHALCDLSLAQCRGFTRLCGLPTASSLHTIDLSFTNVNDDGILLLAESKSLRNVRLMGCVEITNVNAMARMMTLERLDLTSCGELTNDGIAGLGKSNSLREVILRYCKGITDVNCVTEAPSLLHLCVARSSLTQSGIASIGSNNNNGKSLQHLDMTGCRGVKCVGHLACAVSLCLLDVSWANVKRDGLLGLIDSQCLEVLRIAGNPLRSISPLRHMQLLLDVDISDTNIGDDDIIVLATMKALRHITIRHCRHVTSINALAVLPALESIDVTSSAIVNAGITSLNTAFSLTELHLSHCKGISIVSTLAECERLKILHLDGTQITDESIAHLAGSRSLTEIDFSHCSQLSNINTLATISTLRMVDVSFTGVTSDGCSALLRNSTIHIRGVLGLYTEGTPANKKRRIT